MLAGSSTFCTYRFLALVAEALSALWARDLQPVSVIDEAIRALCEQPVSKSEVRTEEGCCRWAVALLYPTFFHFIMK